MITVNNLSFSYPGSSILAMDNLSFSVGKGEIFGFLGPSGAGKSTTQKIMIRLLSGYSGEINILDKPLQQWTNDFYNYIGVGFELPNHYLKLTARENLKHFASFYQVPVQNIDQLLDSVGLLEHADKKVEAFSKGMKMRLNFIRAIMHSPPVIFLDEPTSGLDPANARIIKDIILQLKAKGHTIFLTTHNMHDADELCDRVAFIFNGKIMAMDAPAKLKEKAGEKLVKIKYINGSNELQQQEIPISTINKNGTLCEFLKGKELVHIETQEQSLETIFIQLTGNKLN